MLSDILKTFIKIHEKEGDRLIIDSYIPDDGEYIIISPEEPFKILDKVSIKLDKKNRTIDRTNQYIDFICKADYYSKYLNSNKSIADKNIHSNNYLSFYTRIEGIQNKKVNLKAINGYYDHFRNQEKSYNSKPEEKMLYEKYQEEFGDVDVEKINKIERWIISNLYDLVEFENNQAAYKKTFLRILFYYDLSDYELEGNRYFSTKIYNNNKHNIEINQAVYGLPDNNMGLNEKKPYLKNMTRKDQLPNYRSQEEIIILKKLFDYLSNQFSLGKRNIYVSEDEIIPLCSDESLEEDFTGLFISIRKGKKEIEIEEYDNISDYRYYIRPIKFRNLLNINTGKSKVVYGDINTIEKAKVTIDEVLFSKFLISSFFTEAKDLKMKDVSIKRAIIATRTSLFTWFYKGENKNVWNELDKESTELILSSIFNGHYYKACERFNLKISLKDYFEGGIRMADVIEETIKKLRIKINSNNTDKIESDKEYYFAVGQLINYLLSLNKGANKKLSLANSILNSKTDKRIKEELRKLFIKYNHDIGLSSKRFKNLYSMVASYEPEGKVDQDVLIAGYLHNSLIYEKSEKNLVDTKEEEE